MLYEAWEGDAACAPQNRPANTEDLDWFSTDKDEKYRARAICQGVCPVRKQCIQAALTRKEIHGIWGGVDDYEIRRAMSVDCLGYPLERDRPPRCPYCLSRKLSISGQKSKQGYLAACLVCSLVWHMATIPTRLKNKKTAA